MTPADIAGVRALLTHFRQQGWKHDITTAFGSDPEHRWCEPAKDGWVTSVHLYAGVLSVDVTTPALGTATVFKVDQVDTAQQVADLLSAVGLVPVELTSGYKAAMAVPVERATTYGLGQILTIDQIRRLDRALLDLQTEYGHHDGCDCRDDDDPTCQLDGLWTVASKVIDSLGLTPLAAAPHVEVGGRTAAQVAGEGGGA